MGDAEEEDFLGAPSLAIEVLSPGQGRKKDLGKLEDYIYFGTEEAWLIVPRKRQIIILRGDDEGVSVFNEGDTLTTAVFEGLQIPVTDLFKMQ
jgi:Uma2 family endonuclease